MSTKSGVLEIQLTPPLPLSSLALLMTERARLRHQLRPAEGGLMRPERQQFRDRPPPNRLSTLREGENSATFISGWLIKVDVRSVDPERIYAIDSSRAGDSIFGLQQRRN